MDRVVLEEPLPIAEPEGPPKRHLPPRLWIRENLFNSVLNSILTLVFGALIALAGYRALRFVFVTAQWAIIRDNLTNFMVGFFPRDEIWRLWTGSFVLAVAVGIHWGARRRPDGEEAPPPRAHARDLVRKFWPLALLAVVILAFSGSPVVAALLAGVPVAIAAARAAGRLLPRRVSRWRWTILVLGAIAGFEIVAGFGGVGYGVWRGLLLTLALAVGGIVLSFPVGVLLALGRRSTFPAIRLISVAYIELIRGVPLITLLFMAFLILGFFLPPGSSTPSLVARALVAFVLFTAAYVAEIVRGGLQAVPKGQTEAAQAVGLSPAKITALIVLPQALRAVIPAMVGQFISLFKDTSLAAGIGLIELLGVAQQVTKQPEFLGKGLQAETLVFASLIYWVGAYWMSRTSQRLERRLGVGER